MRVVSGSLGGRVLTCPPDKGVRPLTGRLKNAIFNILGAGAQGVRVLDLYAGCGSFGIEALSRGAASAVFVERDPRHADCLKANLKALGIAAPVHVCGVREALGSLGGGYDLVLADPPYSRDAAALPPDVLADLAALASWAGWSGTLILHHRRGRPPLPPELVPSDLRDYGGATVAFFRNPTWAPEPIP